MTRKPYNFIVRENKICINCNKPFKGASYQKYCTYICQQQYNGRKNNKRAKDKIRKQAIEDFAEVLIKRFKDSNIMSDKNIILHIEIERDNLLGKL